MRSYLDRQPKKQAYYKDRFFIAPEAPKDDAGDKFKSELSALKEAGVEILDAYVQLGDLVVEVSAAQNYSALAVLRANHYEQLSELSAVDFLAQKGKFRLFYQLLSYRLNKRVRLVCEVAPKERVKSVTSLYASANWSERETYDMFGIFFEGHRNLKRLLMPDDWYSHPLLKTYPLHGDEHAKWYEVDRIFGKEYREVIGPENRDSAYADIKDTFNFSQVGAEVSKGDERVQKYVQEYQEEDGVKLVKHPKRGEASIVKERP